MIDATLIHKNWTNPDASYSVKQRPHAYKDWLVGTDGHALVALAGAATDADPKPNETARALLAKLLDSPVEGVEVSLQALREWAGPVEWTVTYECPDCHGEGDEDDEDICVCPYCGDEHEVEGVGCINRDCEDGTVIHEPKARYAWLLGVPVNQVVLARALDGAEDETIRVQRDANPQKPIRFAGEGWRAAISPLAPGAITHDAPRFDAEPVSA